MAAPQSPENDRGAGRGRPERETGASADPRGYRAPRWGFGAFFLAEAVFVLVSVGLAAAFGDFGNGGWVGPTFVLVLMAPTVLAGVVAVAATLVRGNGPVRDFGLRWRRSDVRIGLAIGLCGLVLSTVASVLWTRWVGTEQATSAVGSLLEDVELSPALAVIIFLHVWLVAPVCEELLYRGLLWGAMERLRFNQLTVFLLTTAIFAIGHFEPTRTVLLLVIALPIGLARLITGRLTASVVAHQVNNFLPALGLLLMSLGLLPS
ncbi:CPBP family intramembrane glutamic endopeptidase [Actinopolyspora mortivallis]|uniref:CPBP family intramembrane metalloprotease domain-containing protein n=1 Tax=Actinopolyspora mortivallis TaxID=33906 RepID=A0A2T0GTV9_ACTMO|nr:type II CAAX endopeptidase family protein [Actinopolyspora mortivallis]PRW62558.1 CPBP family intramembrane metalloprotease domain-containing protein [Actinopolyspora mortivallis]